MTLWKAFHIERYVDAPLESELLTVYLMLSKLVYDGVWGK